MTNHSYKKNEEKWKYVFKKSIKCLKNEFSEKFKTEFDIPHEEDFLKYYFKEISDKKNIPLNYYQDPLIRKYRKGKNANKEPNCPKSINTQYFNIIFQSKSFVKDFFHYINTKFYIDCIFDIPDKFVLIFDKYLNDDGKKLKDYFKKNQRCKLPWNFFDIQLAAKSIKNLYEDFLVKNKTD